MKVKEIQPFGYGYAIICPLCGEVLAYSTEEEMMPEFGICDCDRNGNSVPTFEIYKIDEEVFIRRNKPLRFVGKVTMGESDIEDVQWIDKPTSALEIAKTLRKASEFLHKRRE